MNEFERIAEALERIATALESAATAEPTSDRPWSANAINNAARIRRHFGDQRPRSVWTVRQRLGWSHERATPAYRAYLAGADLQESSS